MSTINLISLYQNAFGYKGLPYSKIDTTVTVPKAENDGIFVAEDESELKTFFGTPIFMPCKIQVSKLKDALEYWQLPNEPLIEINGKKRIIKTVFDGNNGSFKENFSLEDYSVIIRGIAVDEQKPNEYPSDQVRKLRAIYELRNSLKIVTQLTTLFGIDRISIEDLRLPSVEGGITFQPYEFVCTSDREFNLEIKKKNA